MEENGVLLITVEKPAIICLVCGKLFHPTNNMNTLCSDECKKKRKATLDKGRVRFTELRNCICCGKPVQRGKGAKTCSEECADKMQSIRAARYRAADPERYNANARRCYKKNGAKYRATARAEYQEYKKWLSEQPEEVQILMRKKKRGKLDT